MSVKKLAVLFTTATLIASSTAVLADDDTTSSYTSGATATLRSGFYAGVGAGYTIGSSSATFNNNGKTAIGSNGFNGQIIAGYDALISPHFYIGGQGFWGIYGVNTPNGPTATSGKLALNYLWGGIAEPGYHITSNTNLFGRVGVVGGNIEIENTAGASDTFLKVGYALGAGGEVGITDNIGIRGQYTFYGLAHESALSSYVTPFFGEGLMSVVYHFA